MGGAKNVAQWITLVALVLGGGMVWGGCGNNSTSLGSMEFVQEKWPAYIFDQEVNPAESPPGVLYDGHSNQR